MKKVTFPSVFNPQISEIGALNMATCYAIPFFQPAVQAGFPSPAEGWTEKALDLNDLCIKNQDSSYFVRVKGDSMVEAGIGDGDYLVIGVAGTSRHGLPKPAEAYMPQGFSWKNKAQHGASNRMS